MTDPALIVIDVQQAFDQPGWGERNNPDAEERVAAAIAGWRERGAPVIHVRHRSAAPEGTFIPGTPAFEFKPEAQPREGEPVITKDVNSAFIGTNLEERLRAAGTSTVALVGLTTDHCCSTTARMAGNLGFETWVLGDAMATFAREAPDGELIAAEVMHRTALASLHGEFAEVISTDDALARLRDVSGGGGDAAGPASTP
jgi:nicotinamidase-related amidase